MSKHDARIARALENVVMQLRRRNDMTEAFYREVLEVLTQAKDPEGSPVGSGQPAAAPDGQESGEPRACRVCGREGNTYCEPGDGPLTKAQWDAHRRNYLRVIKIDDELLAHQQANEHTLKRFGPCPEES